jgi:hypothetical protein
LDYGQKDAIFMLLRGIRAFPWPPTMVIFLDICDIAE